MQGFSPKDLRNVAGVQLAAGVSVALVLSLAFNDIDSAALGYADSLNLCLHLSFHLTVFSGKHRNSFVEYR